jgi:predicted AlkP superfamily pyrophosphatase or phosphodiesterase
MKRIALSPTPRLAPTLLFLALLLLVTGLGIWRATRKAGAPVTLLVAVDGLEWSVMGPLLAEGKLPVMADLMERGSFGYLESMLPTFSPVIWTSVATGKLPEKHGVLDFVYEDRRDGRREYRYYTSGHRKTKAFWNILSDHGLAVHCVGWWITYPAERIEGVMVSQTNTTAVIRDPKRALWKGSLIRGVEGQVHPAELQYRVMELLEEVDTSLEPITDEIFGRWPHPLTSLSRRMWEQTQWTFRADATYLRVAKEILRPESPPDLMAIYLSGPDVVAHRFWRYAYPRDFAHPPPREQIENFSRAIEDYYVYTDRAIGEILELLPENAGVMIVSDHGMHAINTDRLFDADDLPLQTMSAHHLDAPPGVIIAGGGGFRLSGKLGSPAGELDLSSMKTLGSVLDVTPTLLVLMDIPLGEDMDGEPMRDLILPGHEVRRIPTHDTAEWQAGREGRKREAVDQTERLEQLRALGYIQ